MRQEYIEKRKQKMRERRGDAFDWLESIIVALMLCVLLFTFVFRVMGVVGTSMVNTLDEGDRVIVTNLFYKPAQGDIVVVRKDTFSDEPIIKRVIATEGQVVKIDFDTGVVSVDDVPLEEDYVLLETLPMRALDFPSMVDKDAGGVIVPEGCIFALGDNRNGSTDSRAEKIGCIDTRYILGHAVFLLFPGRDLDTQRQNWSRIGLIR